MTTSGAQEDSQVPSSVPPEPSLGNVTLLGIEYCYNDWCPCSCWNSGVLAVCTSVWSTCSWHPGCGESRGDRLCCSSIRILDAMKWTEVTSMSLFSSIVELGLCLPGISAPGHCVFHCSAENLNMNLSSLRLCGGRFGHRHYSYFSKPNAQIQALKCNISTTMEEAGWKTQYPYLQPDFSGER